MTTLTLLPRIFHHKGCFGRYSVLYCIDGFISTGKRYRVCDSQAIRAQALVYAGCST
jgi:hypothetical protein